MVIVLYSRTCLSIHNASWRAISERATNECYLVNNDIDSTSPQPLKPRVHFHYHRLTSERSQNTVLLASTQAVYKAPHSTVQQHLTVSIRCSDKQ